MLVLVFAALADLADLALPQRCLGCGTKGPRLCGTCLDPVPARRMPRPAPDGLPECWSAADYTGAVREAIVAYKERGQTTLAHPLATALAFTACHALAFTAGHAAADRPATPLGDRLATPLGDRPATPVAVAVVPVPSARRALRSRGHDPVGRLAALAVRQLAAFGHRAELWPALGQARQVGDQAGLSATQRAANLAASLRVTPAAKARPAAPVLLVDDIVTTGSTLAEAARTLRVHGVDVLLAVTVAATRRRSCNPLRSH
ncbi:phosphoribosyltransferase family protein [Nonomuraea sp. NPDC049129]|uniref:ComF family protein n=1 Tax=Nonomuraea sp. NPDC049129 TaxID=3155272 RepID=UPI0033E1AF69